MYLLLLGVALVVLKYMEISPFAAWAWWMVLIPFGLALAWWSWADSSGYTKRKSVDRENKKHQERLERRREAITNVNSNSSKKGR
jgi:small Trp-rich protein